jgi:urease accessory protein UreF
MSVVTAKMETSKEMENKMEKTFTEIQNEIEAIVKSQNPNRLDLTYAILWGIAVAHLTKEQMENILENRKAN